MGIRKHVFMSSVSCTNAPGCTQEWLYSLIMITAQYMYDTHWWGNLRHTAEVWIKFQWSHALVLIVGKVWNTHLSVQVTMIVFVLLEMMQIFHSVVTNHLQTDLLSGWETPLVQFSPSSLSSSPHLVVHSWSYCLVLFLQAKTDCLHLFVMFHIALA